MNNSIITRPETPPPLKLIFLDQLKYSYIISVTGIDLKSVLGSEVNFNELELTHFDGLASLHWLLTLAPLPYICPVYIDNIGSVR